MGKTLTNILVVAAAIAVNVIPGVGQALSAAIGSTLATAVISTITLAGLQSAVGLLGIGGGVKPDTTETAIKTPRPPRVGAYGRSRLYGAYVLFETAPNGTAVDVYAVADGKLDAVERYYLNDEQATVGGGGVVATGADGRYKGGAVNLYHTDGSVPGAGFPTIAGLLGSVWSGARRGDGVVCLALTAKAVKAKVYQETYPSGTVPVPSIVARWQLCPDPAAADPLDESAWTWTENPVRQLLHYKLTREGRRPAIARSAPGYDAQLAAIRAEWWARKIAPTLDYWIAAAAICDAPRALKAGGSEPMYRSCVSHKLTDKHQEPIGALLATFDGWMMPRADGALAVYAGQYYEPTVAVTPDEIVSYSFEGGEPDEAEGTNEIIVSYVSAEHDFNTVEADAWRDEADIARRGQVLSTPLEVQIPSHAQGRYLAKRLMHRRNSGARGTVTTNIAGRGVLGQRFIDLHLEEAGTVFYSGPAEILGARRVLRGGVTFEWTAADPNVDAWNPALEEGEPATVGERVAAQPIDTPVITSATFDGTKLRVEISAPDRDDLTWYMQQRVVGATVWGEIQEYADIDASAAVVLETTNVPGAADIELQVAYQIGDGRYSEWSATATTSTTAPRLAWSTVGSAARDGSGNWTRSGGDGWGNGGRTTTAANDVRMPAEATDSTVVALDAAPYGAGIYDADFAFLSAAGGAQAVVFENGSAGAAKTGLTAGVSYYGVRRVGGAIQWYVSVAGDGSDETVFYTKADPSGGADLAGVTGAYYGAATWGPVVATAEADV